MSESNLSPVVNSGALNSSTGMNQLCRINISEQECRVWIVIDGYEDEFVKIELGGRVQRSRRV